MCTTCVVLLEEMYFIKYLHLASGKSIIWKLSMTIMVLCCAPGEKDAFLKRHQNHHLKGTLPTADGHGLVSHNTAFIFSEIQT